MKIMIVEDEPLLRQGLISKIDWNKLHVELAGEAENGNEALELLNTCQPEIVITDIRMPGMDGIQFIGEARKNFPDLKFIIVSGYNDFEYARDAMRYNVKDYLLKPVNTLKLHDLLADLCEELREEKREAEERSKIDTLKHLFESREIDANDYQMTHFVMEPSSPSNPLPPNFTERSCFAAASVKITYGKEKSRFRGNEQSLERFAVLNVLRNNFSREVDALSFRHAINPDEIVILLGFNEQNMLDNAVREMSHALEWIDRYLGSGVSIGIGGMKEAPALLYSSYAEAKKSVKNRLLAGEGKIFAEQNTTNEAMDFSPVLNEQSQNTLLTLLQGQKYKEFLSFTERLLRSLVESPNARYDQVEYLYVEIVHLIRKYMHVSSKSMPAIDLADMADDLEHMTNWTEIIARIRQQLERLEQSPKQDQDNSGDHTVYSVKNYMNKHFDEDITLQWVSDNYFIHPNYFSKRFKKLVGISFNQYLTKIRMEQAQYLLAATSLKIAQIARLVGYEDQNYFCNVFKKWFGISPSQYRQDHVPLS